MQQNAEQPETDMPKPEEFTGTLENWAIDDRYRDGFVLWGRLYGDTKSRFRDGTLIHTSKVIELDETRRFVRTRNSVYYLGKKHEPVILKTYDDIGGQLKSNKG